MDNNISKEFGKLIHQSSTLSKQELQIYGETEHFRDART